MRISFAVQPSPADPDFPEVVPVIDGVPLTERVVRYESESRMEPTGEDQYGGLIPAFSGFEPAADHYLGRSLPDGDGKVVLLGCSCGEWGCWPLLARVVVGDDAVEWRDFEQPHRPVRDYAGFGPFVFERRAYEAAVSDVADVWDPAVA